MITLGPDLEVNLYIFFSFNVAEVELKINLQSEQPYVECGLFRGQTPHPDL